jgi:hypothetical protein
VFPTCSQEKVEQYLVSRTNLACSMSQPGH